MDKTISNVEIGRYKHYKGKYYIVLGYAVDEHGVKYIVYRAEYGKKEFWIRPSVMFCDLISDGVSRFSRSKTKQENKQVEAAVKDICDGSITLTHSETNVKYSIISAETDDVLNMLIIPELSISCGYMSDFHLAKRMGWYLYRVDGESKLVKLPPQAVSMHQKFAIYPTGKRESWTDEMEKEIIQTQMHNPCSVDLRISDICFYKTKMHFVDIRSLSYAKSSYCASDLWRKLRLKRKSGSEWFVLWPKQSVLTRTYEWIKIPEDCAGKIEIRSTYARLSLSVTTGDFCNPGWEGYFPLVLRNDGTNPIKIYPKEMMLQLMLIPISSMPVTPYTNNHSYMYDDGTPFGFWNNKYAKIVRDQSGHQDILDFYSKMSQRYSDNPDMKDRFDNTFLRYCEKRVRGDRYKDQNGSFDMRLLYSDYITTERKKYRFSLKRIGSGCIALLSAVGMIATIACELFSDLIAEDVLALIKTHRLPLLIASAIVLVLSVVVFFSAKEAHCTEKRALE